MRSAFRLVVVRLTWKDVVRRLEPRVEARVEACQVFIVHRVVADPAQELDEVRVLLPVYLPKLDDLEVVLRERPRAEEVRGLVDGAGRSRVRPRSPPAEAGRGRRRRPCGRRRTACPASARACGRKRSMQSRRSARSIDTSSMTMVVSLAISSGWRGLRRLARTFSGSCRPRTRRTGGWSGRAR